MYPSILFVHFKLNTRWQANAVHRLHVKFPHYLIDNVRTHINAIVEAKQSSGDEMIYLHELIYQSNGVVIHVTTPLGLTTFQAKILHTAISLGKPVWFMNDEYTIFMDFHLNPNLLPCLVEPYLV